MAEKDFIKDGMGNEEIIATIKEIIAKKELDENKKLNDFDKYEKLKNEFTFFADRYPMLFELTLKNQDHLIHGRAYGVTKNIEANKSQINADCRVIDPKAKQLYNQGVKNTPGDVK